MIYGIILWVRTFYTLRLVSAFSGLFAILEKLVPEILIFGIFYLSQLFLFSVVGVVLFSDLEGFKSLNTTMFTLFLASISDIKIDQMREARVG